MKSEIFFGLLSIGFFILVLAFVFFVMSVMSSYPVISVLSVACLLLFGGYVDWRAQKKMRFLNKKKYFEL